MHDWFLDYYAGLEAVEGNDAFNRWRDSLPSALDEYFRSARHGRLPEWRQVLAALPDWPAETVELDRPEVTVGADPGPDAAAREELARQLRRFVPWRKGPYRLHGVGIDSEWRSELKWDRLSGRIAPLQERLVLDVGCGNGYHCWRMRGAGARAVIGVDPTLAYVMQYFAVQHFIRSNSVFVLPWALEALAFDLQVFDTVFSMGVLYHSRAPLEHLRALRRCLRAGGELVLETLVVEGDEQQALVPRDRYACMKNVWFIPSVAMLTVWLTRCGFRVVRCIDVAQTRSQEQRATEWSGDASLTDFLDPACPNRTAEGYPAPRRAILTALK